MLCSLFHSMDWHTAITIRSTTAGHEQARAVLETSHSQQTSCSEGITNIPQFSNPRYQSKHKTSGHEAEKQHRQRRIKRCGTVQSKPRSDSSDNQQRKNTRTHVRTHAHTHSRTHSPTRSIAYKIHTATSGFYVHLVSSTIIKKS